MSILGNTSLDVNKILPMKRPWAWDMYKKGVANNWTPEEIAMMDDIEQWKTGKLTEEEKNMALLNYGFFSVSESLTGNNLLLAIYKYIKDPACRMYLIRQTFEESVHTDMFVYICDSLGLDPEEVYTMYKNVAEIKEKDDFVLELTKELSDDNIDIETPEGKLALLRNLVGFYLVMEGIFFYGGIAQMLAMQNKNKLTGTGQQFTYLLRDECLTKTTQLLTTSGWKNITDVNYEDDIAQWHPDGSITFTKPKKLSKSYVNQVYRFKNYQNHINQVVSENHRICYLTKDNNLKVVTAKEATPNPYCKFINTGKLNQLGKDKLNDYERFLIAYQADGHSNGDPYRNGKYSNTKYCVFSFKKQRKIDRLHDLLKSLKWDYNTSLLKDGKTVFYVNVPLQFSVYKTFDKWIHLSNITSNWCAEFINEVSYWDGHRVNNGEDNRITYGSVIESNTDYVQAIASLAGYRTNKKTVPDDRKETFSDYHKLHIVKDRDYVLGGKIKKTIEDYNDYVYGVEVDSSFLLIRNEGAVSVTGNSLHVEFGVNVINSIKDEFPEIWSDDVQDELVNIVKEAVRLEHIYLEKTCPKAVVGIPQKMFKQYIEYIADRRLESIGLPAQYKTENPFPWLSKVMDLTKETNFFEKRPTEYSIGTLGDWD